MNFGEFVELYEKDKRIRLKQHTWMTKQNIIETKILPYFKDKKINQIKASDIIQWQNTMIEYKNEKGKKFASTYLKTMQSQLSAIFNHAVRFYDLKSNPVVKAGPMGKYKADEMLFWTEDEYIQFSNVMKDKPQFYLAFEILYYCGLRLGELLALTTGDSDFEKALSRLLSHIRGWKAKMLLLTLKRRKVEEL